MINLKESQYNIFIPYKNKTLIFNTLNSCFIEIDNNIKQVIKNIHDSNENFLNEYKQVISVLKSCGIIIDDNIDEIDILRKEKQTNRDFDRNFEFTIAPTLQCNFKCSYCYEKRMSACMTSNIIDLICQKIKQVAEKKKNIVVNWFGGEPLLVKNIIVNISTRIIEICKLFNVEYTARMVTNGYLLDDKTINMLKSLNINAIQITIDGPPNIHNFRRPLKNKKKETFQTILNNVKQAQKAGMEIKIRINIDKTNSFGVEKLLEIFAKNDLHDCSFNLGHIKSYTNTCKSCENTVLSIQEYAIYMVNLEKLLLKHKLRTSKFLSFANTNKFTNYCCADKPNSLVIDPFGNLFKCWTDIGNSKASFGNIHTSNDTSTNISSNSKKYIQWDPLNYKKCLKCEVLPICKGGCPYMGLQLGETECAPWKYNLIDMLKLRYDNYEKHN